MSKVEVTVTAFSTEQDILIISPQRLPYELSKWLVDVECMVFFHSYLSILLLITLHLTSLLMNTRCKAYIYIMILALGFESSSGKVFLIVVVQVSSIVILFSLDYMTQHELPTFISYLMIFQFAMLLFLSTSSMLVLFLAWELLGLASFLLIHFWGHKVECAMKAVIYNRVGDFSLLMGMALTYLHFYSFDIEFIILLTALPWSPPLGLFLVAMFTKSAQLPFSSWLIAAMAAPTPVSALLHSSTMVVAGLYLGILFYWTLHHPVAATAISTTLLWSGVMALVKSDIKSIIAYSTISQLAFMFVSTNPILTTYHFTVHAYFKSLFFLVAGSIITSNQSLFQCSSSSTILLLVPLISLITATSKELIIKSSVLSTFLLLGAAFTVAYSGRIFYYLILNPYTTKHTTYIYAPYVLFTLSTLASTSCMTNSLLFGAFFEPIALDASTCLIPFTHNSNYAFGFVLFVFIHMFNMAHFTFQLSTMWMH